MANEKIFISYKRENLDKVRAIVKEIEAQTGVDCWLDIKKIDDESYFEDHIVKAINRCPQFIFMLSKESSCIPDGISWTKREISFAEQKGKSMTIISIDGTMIQDCDWLAFKYGGLNVIDYSIDYQKEILFNGIRNRFGTQNPDNQTEETPKKQEETPTAQQLFAKGKAEYDQKNCTEATKRYRKSAEQGDVAAQYNLGFRYYYGHGVARDISEAAKWYRKAAEQGHAGAQYNLGKCYYNGQGVAEDYSEAVKWYRKAAEQGDAYAQFLLGDCYYNGEGVAKDYSEAAKWWRRAARQGHKYAQFELGLCYHNGRGVAKDYSEAAKWYRKAAEQGNEAAKNALKKIPFWNRLASFLTEK